MFYNVVWCSAEETHVATDDARVMVPTELITTLSRPVYSLTYHGVQGRTIPGFVRLHDTYSSLFTKRHLAVGIGRATGVEYVQVEYLFYP